MLGHSMKIALLVVIGILCGCTSPRTSEISGKVANPEMLGEREMVNYNIVSYSKGGWQGGGKYERNVYKFSIVPILIRTDGHIEIWKRRSRWPGDPFTGGNHNKDEIVSKWIPCGDKFYIEVPKTTDGEIVIAFKSVTEPGQFGYVYTRNADRVTCDEMIIAKMNAPNEKFLEILKSLSDE